MNGDDGHTAPVSAAAVSPDGRVYASGSYDRTVLLWDAESGRVLRRIAGHAHLINGLEWSPDGALLASASSDHTARVWHPLTGREVCRLIGHTDDVNAVRWSPDGSRLATASFDGTVRVWARSGACLLVAAHHRSDVNGLSWFPDGSRLAAVSDDGTISIFEADGGRVRRVMEGHEDWVDQVAVHPDGLLLASAGIDGTVGVWNACDGTRIASLDASTCVVKAVAWSPDGRTLAATSYDGFVRVYESGSFRLCREYRHEGLWNRTLAWSPRGWVTGSFGGGPIVLGDDGPRRFGRATTAGLNGFAIAPDGRTAVACCDDGRLYEVDLRERRVRGVIGEHGAAALCVGFSPDGRLVASGAWDRVVRIWDRATGRVVASSDDFGQPVNAVAFDEAGERLWIGTFNGTLVAWDFRRGESEVVSTHKGSIKYLARSGSAFASAGRDGSVRTYDGDRRGRFSVGETIVNGVALADGGRRIATVSRRTGVELWSGDGKPLGSFRGHPCSAKSVAFSGDGGLVAASYYDGRVALWDTSTGMARVDPISDASLSQVAFADDRIVVSGWDARGTLHFVDPRTGASEDLPVAA